MKRARWALLIASSIALASSCALAHERFDDAAVVTHDSGPAAPDAATVTSCSDFWRGLSSCPASGERALGQPCPVEDAACGTRCCEPGPPIRCQGGRWMPTDFSDDCRGIRCMGPQSCGMGSCGAGRVCVVPAGELGGPAPELCVLPPAPIHSCREAPRGSIGEDPMSCTACTCAATPDGQIVVTLDCRCC